MVKIGEILRKLRWHGTGFVVAGGTVGCHNNNPWSPRWRRGWPCDGPEFSLFISAINTQTHFYLGYYMILNIFTIGLELMLIEL